MHDPVVAAGALASGSVCHHLQSLQTPHGSLMILLLSNGNSRNWRSVKASTMPESIAPNQDPTRPRLPSWSPGNRLQLRSGLSGTRGGRFDHAGCNSANRSGWDSGNGWNSHQEDPFSQHYFTKAAPGRFESGNKVHTPSGAAATNARAANGYAKLVRETPAKCVPLSNAAALITLRRDAIRIVSRNRVKWTSLHADVNAH
jgi:hypothetical protein